MPETAQSHSFTQLHCCTVWKYFFGDWLCRWKWLYRCQPFKVDPVDPFRISFSQSKTSAGETRKPKAVWRIEQYWTHSDIVLSTHRTHIMMLLPGMKGCLWFPLGQGSQIHPDAISVGTTAVWTCSKFQLQSHTPAPCPHHACRSSSFSLFAHSCHRLASPVHSGSVRFIGQYYSREECSRSVHPLQNPKGRNLHVLFVIIIYYL